MECLLITAPRRILTLHRRTQGGLREVNPQKTLCLNSELLWMRYVTHYNRSRFVRSPGMYRSKSVIQTLKGGQLYALKFWEKQLGSSKIGIGSSNHFTNRVKSFAKPLNYRCYAFIRKCSECTGSKGCGVLWFIQTEMCLCRFALFLQKRQTPLTHGFPTGGSHLLE